jgi:hypothetical protein
MPFSRMAPKWNSIGLFDQVAGHIEGLLRSESFR